MEGNARMNKQLRTRKLQVLSKAEIHHVHATDKSWRRLYTTVTDPDLQMIVAFCLIGLLLTLNVMLRFPDVGAIIEQYNQF